MFGRRATRPISGLLLAVLLLGACDREPQAPLIASDIVITEPLPGRNMSAGYLSLRNNSDEAIDITAVSSDEFDVVAIHETSFKNGIARMRPVEVLTIAAHSTVALEHGGKHLMLIRPTGAATVNLNFYSGTQQILTVSTTITSRKQ